MAAPQLGDAGIPGRRMQLVELGLCASFHASACSRPPEPTTSTPRRESIPAPAGTLALTMSARRTFVIVGASLAGGRAAGTLREEGFDGRVVLLGEEPQAPYSRPSLSKGYLAGERERPSPVYDDGFYEEHEIELRTSTLATAIDRNAAEVELESGERIGYDQLLLTTGAMPRALPVPGAELDNVLLLRRVGDSDAIRAHIDRGARIVVIGGGRSGRQNDSADLTSARISCGLSRVLKLKFKIIYEPGAAVVHSHDRSLIYDYKRAYICNRLLYRQFGVGIAPTFFGFLRTWFDQSALDFSYVAQMEKRITHKLRLLPMISAVNLVTTFGQYRAVKDEIRGNRMKVKGV